MLADCAPDTTWRLATHCRVFTRGLLKYPSFPKHDNVEIGHVRKLVRNLGIDEACAHRHIALLKA